MAKHWIPISRESGKVLNSISNKSNLQKRLYREIRRPALLPLALVSLLTETFLLPATRLTIPRLFAEFNYF